MAATKLIIAFVRFAFPRVNNSLANLILHYTARFREVGEVERPSHVQIYEAPTF
jgi:hypothetical protein